jgi:hypothetical protein
MNLKKIGTLLIFAAVVFCVWAFLPSSAARSASAFAQNATEPSGCAAVGGGLKPILEPSRA